MIQKILKVIFCIAIGLLLSFAFVQIVAKGLDCQEEYECHKWADWAKEYPLFYFTQWQADQCKAHGIEVNAPVHEQAKPEAKAEVKETMTATVYSYSSDENQTDGNPNRMASNKDVCPGVIACPSRWFLCSSSNNTVAGVQATGPKIASKASGSSVACVACWGRRSTQTPPAKSISPCSSWVTSMLR